MELNNVVARKGKASIWKCYIRFSYYASSGLFHRNRVFSDVTPDTVRNGQPITFDTDLSRRVSIHSSDTAEWWAPSCNQTNVSVLNIDWWFMIKLLRLWIDDFMGYRKRVWNYVLLSTHLPLDKMTAISQTISSDALFFMNNFVLWSKCQWRLFLRVQLTIIQHWFR